MAVSRKPPSNIGLFIIAKVLVRSGTFWYVLTLALNFVVRSDTFQNSSGTFLPVFVHAWCFCGTLRYVPEKFWYVLPCVSFNCIILWYVLIRSVQQLRVFDKIAVFWHPPVSIQTTSNPSALQAFSSPSAPNLNLWYVPVRSVIRSDTFQRTISFLEALPGPCLKMPPSPSPSPCPSPSPSPSPSPPLPLPLLLLLLLARPGVFNMLSHD